MEIESYLYERNNQSHLFYFETYEPLIFLNQLNIDKINISNLFFEISEGNNYRWLNTADININDYRNLLLLIGSIMICL